MKGAMARMERHDDEITGRQSRVELTEGDLDAVPAARSAK